MISLNHYLSLDIQIREYGKRDTWEYEALAMAMTNCYCQPCSEFSKIIARSLNNIDIGLIWC